MRHGGAEAGPQEHTGGETRTLPQSLSHSVTQSLTEPIHVSDTPTYSQDGSARECNIQDARDGGLCFGIAMSLQFAAIRSIYSKVCRNSLCVNVALEKCKFYL